MKYLKVEEIAFVARDKMHGWYVIPHIPMVIYSFLNLMLLGW